MVIGLVVLAVAGTRVIDTRGEVGIDNFSLAPLSKIYWPEALNPHITGIFL